MQILRKNILILGISLAVVVLATLFALRSQGQNNQIASGQENPSPVQEGVMTEKQRVHSKRFSQRYAYRKGQKLRDLRGRGDLLVTIGVGDKPQSASVAPFNLPEFLRKMTCDADAVLIGQVRDKVSQLTENREFIFTDYEVTVEEILKNNAESQSALKVTSLSPDKAERFNSMARSFEVLIYLSSLLS
jgi:hypothetical protein